MAKYVDGVVIAIKKTNLKKYQKDAALGRKVWMEHGALDYYECVGDDLQDGKGCRSGNSPSSSPTRR